MSLKTYAVDASWVRVKGEDFHLGRKGKDYLDLALIQKR
jgi:hypothetical protein